MRDGASALQQALDEGFTDFVVIGLMENGDPNGYRLCVFSRPRPRPCLLHIMQTADLYVAHNLPNPDHVA